MTPSRNFIDHMVHGTMGVPYDIDDTMTGCSLVLKTVKSNEIKITFLFLNQNLFSYINIVCFFQILVLIFTDACGKSLRRKKCCNTYREKNSVLLHPYFPTTCIK